MTKHNRQIAIVAILALAVAFQSFFLRVHWTEGASTTPAAHFGRVIHSHNVQRTLRPEGQTESADLVYAENFEAELAPLLSEVWHAPFTVDSLYLAPTAQTAKLMLKRAFRKLENVYVPEAYDCDDNAQELMVLLRKEALVEFREFPAALAIGFVGVRIDGPIYEFNDMTPDPKDYPMYHAMVVMRIKGGHWLLIEPLSHQVCEFTGPIYEGQMVVGLLYF